MNTSQQNFLQLARLAAFAGFSAVVCFCTSFIVVGLLTDNYHLITDYMSLLGAVGNPFALYWNILGFVIVGILIAVFGWTYGLVLKDKLIGSCLVVTGLGFSLGAVPFDFADVRATFSVVHFLSISLSLAGWYLAMARIAYIASSGIKLKRQANWFSILGSIPIVGLVTGIIPEPVAHRLIIIVIFSWIVLTSSSLFKDNDQTDGSA